MREYIGRNPVSTRSDIPQRCLFSDHSHRSAGKRNAPAFTYTRVVHRWLGTAWSFIRGMTQRQACLAAALLLALVKSIEFAVDPQALFFIDSDPFMMNA